MITIDEIKKEIVRLLKVKYQKHKIYGIEVIEGYEKPSFFVDIRLISREQQSPTAYEDYYNISIVYFQKQVNENDMLVKIEEISDCLISKDEKNKNKVMNIKVKDRFLPVTGFETDRIGERNDILQINFDLRFFNARNRTEDAPMMEQVILNKEMEE